MTVLTSWGRRNCESSDGAGVYVCVLCLGNIDLVFVVLDRGKGKGKDMGSMLEVGDLSRIGSCVRGLLLVCVLYPVA